MQRVAQAANADDEGKQRDAANGGKGTGNGGKAGGGEGEGEGDGEDEGDGDTDEAFESSWQGFGKKLIEPAHRSPKLVSVIRQFPD